MGCRGKKTKLLSGMSECGLWTEERKREGEKWADCCEGARSCFGSSLGRRDSLVGNLHDVAKSKRTSKTTNTTTEFAVHVQAGESGRLHVVNDEWKDLSSVTAIR